ncbi:transposase zinc-binding domain-containing protein [Leisingera sp. M523]|uniref:transposase zinc-binding domain-containing protein n=1 Tax=Leisingera sp. M523 TaxID=2867013 RepID=UPI0038FCD23D
MPGLFRGDYREAQPRGWTFPGRNRHSPKRQGAAVQDWMQARMEDLLPAGYFYVVFTLPARTAGIAYQNKAAYLRSLASRSRSVC